MLQQKINIPSFIKVELNYKESELYLTGPLGEMKIDLTKNDFEGRSFFLQQDNNLIFKTKSHKNKKKIESLSNFLKKSFYILSQGHVVTLNLKGVGFKANVLKDNLTLQLGFSHSVQIKIPEDTCIFCPKPEEIYIYGIDKQQVSQLAASIRDLKIPDAYKARGITYLNEIRITKESKKK